MIDTQVSSWGLASIRQPDSVLRWALVIGAGILATNLSQPDTLDLPFRRLLKDDLDLSPEAMAAFFALGALPWYLKIVAGFLSDSIPLFGTRRRHYLIFSALFAGLLWIALAFLPRSYIVLLLGVIAINTMLVVGSTVVGGVLAEAGQRLGAAGRLVAARVFVESACTLLAGPLAGFLAGLPFGLASAAGAAIAFSVIPVAVILLTEPRAARYKSSVLTDAYTELSLLLRSPLVWITALFLFLVFLPQEFATPLYYHQKNELQLTDDLIGWLKFVAGAGSILASAGYAYLCQRLPLRSLATLSISCGAAGALIYIFYRSIPAAFAIEFMHGILYTLSTLAMIELAVWATPRAAAAMGFALCMSAFNLGDSIGDVVAAEIVQRSSVGFSGLVIIYAAVTALTLCALPFLPRALFDHRESASGGVGGNEKNLA